MSKLKAIIYTSKNNIDNLEFENDDIIAISTNSKVINDIETPEFDVFPNNGTLTVKDKDLNIYNKALEGVFDDFRYKVEYFVDNVIFASHIINERPRYDYEDKTCTFYLGNDLDNLNFLPTTVYPYPKKAQTLKDVFKNLMSSIFNLTSENVDKILEKTFGKHNGSGAIIEYATYSTYFENIVITYPFLSATNAREALKTILAISQCGLYRDENNQFELIRLDGFADKNDLNSNVYLIEPQHINKGFIPSVILNNKYDKFTIQSKNCLKNIYYGEEVFKQTHSGDTISINESYNVDTSVKYGFGYDHQGDEQFWTIAAQRLNTKKTFDYSATILRDQDNNLIRVEEIFESLKQSNQNPSISILADKAIASYNADISVFSTNDYATFEIENYSLQGITHEEIYFNTIEEAVALDSFSYQADTYRGLTPDRAVAESITIKNEAGLTKRIVGANKFEINLTNYLCGITGERVYGDKFTQQGGQSTTGTYKGVWERITIVPKSITITIKGTIYKIEFKNVSTVYANETTPNNNYSLQKPLEMFQNTAVLQLPSDSNNSINPLSFNLIDINANNLLNAFKGGIHTGEVTVIRSNYKQKSGAITKNKLFKIGDKVMPCKDYNQTPIVTRGTQKTPVIFQVIDVETYAEGGALFQTLKLREIKEIIN